jgi:hypothetical protein
MKITEWVSQAFGKGCQLGLMDEKAFYWTGLKSIVIPSSVVVLGRGSFAECKSFESVTFDSGSQLERIDDMAFSGSGLKSIVIPSSVVVLGKKSFSHCSSLETVTFEKGSRLEWIHKSMFGETRVNLVLLSQRLATSKAQESSQKERKFYFDRISKSQKDLERTRGHTPCGPGSVVDVPQAVRPPKQPSLWSLHNDIPMRVLPPANWPRA